MLGLPRNAPLLRDLAAVGVPGPSQQLAIEPAPAARAQQPSAHGPADLASDESIVVGRNRPTNVDPSVRRRLDESEAERQGIPLDRPDEWISGSDQGRAIGRAILRNLEKKHRRLESQKRGGGGVKRTEPPARLSSPPPADTRGAGRRLRSGRERAGVATLTADSQPAPSEPEASPEEIIDDLEFLADFMVDACLGDNF